MNRFIERLKDDRVIIGDGAMGTRLQELGLAPDDLPEKWNLSRPGKIATVHEEYIRAGSELIETNTFGANPIRLKEKKLEGQFEDIIREAVKIAREVAADNTLIAGSVGPTGKLMQPYGVLSPEEAFAAYKDQIGLLVANGVDVIIIETMIDLVEIEQVLRSVREYNIPVIAQMNFQESMKTVMGCSIKDTVSLFEDYEVDVIGINCTPGAKRSLPIIEEIHKETSKPLSIYPNAGEPELAKGVITYPEEPEDFIPFIDKFLVNNVKLMGGCCGTTPAFIEAIKRESEAN